MAAAAGRFGASDHRRRGAGRRWRRGGIPPEGYAIDIDVGGAGWVRVPPADALERVRARYRAGLAESWEALPAPIRQGAVLLAVHLFDGRGASVAPPAAVAALWRPWRRVRLAPERRVA